MSRLIKNIAPKLPEIGRLRAGEKGKKGEPRRLDTWRLTSRDLVVVQAFAARYGGEVGEWADHPGEHEVVSEIAEIDIYLPPDPLMSAYERWGSGGCKRRCDGELCDVPVESDDGGHLEQRPCECDDKGWVPGDQGDIKKGACSIAVRLQVVDPYAPGMGHYLLTSSSKIAAAELPGQVGLLAQMAEQGAYVPAVLAIEHREEKKPWEKYRREYNVPVLRIRFSPQQMAQLGQADAMREQLGGTPVGIGNGAAGELTAGNGSGGGGEVTPGSDTTPVSAPPAKAPPAKAPAKKAAAAKKAAPVDDGRPRPFVRVVETAAKRAGIDGPELDALCRHVAQIDNVDAITEPGQGNAMLAAFKDIAAGKLTLAYADDGTPSWVAEGGEVVQGELVGGDAA